MTKFKWYTYQQGTKLVENPGGFNSSGLNNGPILIANCLNKNGAYGAVCVMKRGLWYWLEASNNDTGKLWKSPDDLYPTIEDAVNAAEKLWKSVD